MNDTDNKCVEFQEETYLYEMEQLKSAQRCGILIRFFLWRGRMERMRGEKKDVEMKMSIASS